MQAPAQARSANGAVFYTPDGKPLEIRDVRRLGGGACYDKWSADENGC